MENPLYKSLLSEFVRFKSISTNSQYQSDINQMIDWLKRTFTNQNFNTEVVEGYGNPILVAHYEVDPALKTCLIYGHYDVQPAELKDGWNSEPFELMEFNGRLIARGAIDNKGQVLVHIATVFDLLNREKLGYNIKFMLEGNEETGSPDMGKFIQENRELLKSDFVMLSDGEITGNHPVLELGFRGGFNSTLTVKTASNDLHSGIYGGIAPSAAHELVKFLDTLYDTDFKITIPHFYDNVDLIVNPPKIEFNQNEYEQITGCKTVIKEPEFDEYTCVGLRPSVQVTGIQSGYVGEGYRNGIPSRATAKINFRLVKSQKPLEIIELFKEYIKNTLPDYVSYEFEATDPYTGSKLDLNNEYVEKARKLLNESYGSDPLLKYSGGGLPIVTYFDEVLHVPQVLVPMANEDCNMHGVNENFKIEDLEKALKFSEAFFSK